MAKSEFVQCVSVRRRGAKTGKILCTQKTTEAASAANIAKARALAAKLAKSTGKAYCVRPYKSTRKWVDCVTATGRNFGSDTRKRKLKRPRRKS